MRYTLNHQAPVNIERLHAAVAALGLTGFTGISLEPGAVHIEVPEREDPLTDAEAESIAAVLAAHDPAPDYRELRAAAYDERVPLGDQLDAVRKFLATLSPPPGSDLARVLSEVAAIKAEFPKS